jgi:hypothetical protein
VLESVFNRVLIIYWIQTILLNKSEYVDIVGSYAFVEICEDADTGIREP